MVRGIKRQRALSATTTDKKKESPLYSQDGSTWVYAQINDTSNSVRFPEEAGRNGCIPTIVNDSF